MCETAAPTSAQWLLFCTSRRGISINHGDYFGRSKKVISWTDSLKLHYHLSKNMLLPQVRYWTPFGIFFFFFSPEVAEIQRNGSVLQFHDSPRYCVFPLPLSILAPCQCRRRLCHFSVTYSSLIKRDAPYQEPPWAQKGAWALAHAGQAQSCIASPLSRRDPQL